MRRAVNTCHPSIWKIIEVLQHDHALYTVAIAQSVGGHMPEPLPKKYVGMKNELRI